MSEKVKEIKKVLEEAIEWCARELEKDLFQKSLTLINELESENERLTEERDLYKKQFNELEPRFFDLREENEKLKQDLKKSIDMQKEMLYGFKLSTKEVEENLGREIPNLLKQFAERLKEQIKAKVDFYNDEVFDYGYNGIREIDIDETLEEFLK